MNKEKLKLEREITTDGKDNFFALTNFVQNKKNFESSETDNPDVKSVVKVLSSALGIDTAKATNLVSPKKKP